MGNMFSSSSSPADPPETPSPRFICLEGNVASGKSSCLSALREEGYTVYTEPIETDWAALFKLKSEDPKRWTFAFQVKVMCTLEEQKKRARSLAQPVKGNVIFFERSTRACLAFSKLAHSNGNLSDVELELLTDLCTKWDTGADAYLYLQSPDPACLDRMHQRNRPEERQFLINDLAAIRQAMEAEGLDAAQVDAGGPVDMTVANVLLYVSGLAA